jgi:hypothetical protein
MVLFVKTTRDMQHQEDKADADKTVLELFSPIPPRRRAKNKPKELVHKPKPRVTKRAPKKPKPVSKPAPRIHPAKSELPADYNYDLIAGYDGKCFQCNRKFTRGQHIHAVGNAPGRVRYCSNICVNAAQQASANVPEAPEDRQASSEAAGLDIRAQNSPQDALSGTREA